MVGDENRDVFRGEVTDHELDIVDGQGINVCKGLIEKEEAGIGDEGAGDL